jgi:hypothetical protein
MDELIKRIEHACEAAARACCSTRPSANEDAAYQYGRLQGKFAGLTDALNIILEFNDQDVGDFGEDENETAEEEVN